jgi:hypothetical protein
MLGGTVVDLQSPTSPDEIVPKPSTAIQTLDLQVDIATSEKKFKFQMMRIQSLLRYLGDIVIYNMQIVAILYIPEYLSFMVYPTWAVP